MGRRPGLCNKAAGIAEQGFMADRESPVLWTPLWFRVRRGGPGGERRRNHQEGEK